MKSDVVRLFQTLPHACGYFAERTAQNLVIDPASPHLAQIYDAALVKGYRRAGGHGLRRERTLGCVYILRPGRIAARPRHLRDPAPDRTRARTRVGARISRLLDRRSSEDGLQGALSPAGVAGR